MTSAGLQKFLHAFAAAGGALAGAVAEIGAGAGPDAILTGAGVGTVVGITVDAVAQDLASRRLSQRQEVRIGAAASVALREIQRRLKAGDELREDGFFEPRARDRAAAEEVLEGVLVECADAYEERKVPLIARIFGNTAFRPDVHPAQTSYILSLADSVTYRQLVLLGMVASEERREDLFWIERLLTEMRGIETAPDPSVWAELQELGTRRLIGVERYPGEVHAAYATTGQAAEDGLIAVLGGLRPLGIGALAVDLMELRTGIDDQDAEEALALLAGRPEWRQA